MCLPRWTSPYLSVAHADELAGLPPTFIGVGTLDLFVAESIAYAQQLIRCRVASELRIYPGVMHGFDWHKEARAALQFVSDHLACRMPQARGLSPSSAFSLGTAYGAGEVQQLRWRRNSSGVFPSALRKAAVKAAAFWKPLW